MFLLLIVCVSLLYAELLSAETFVSMSLMFLSLEFTGLNRIHWLKAADMLYKL